MAAPAETIRRLQIAAIGLFAVIMVGSLTRLVVDRADEGIAPEEIDVVTGETLPATGPAEKKPAENVDEPLAELGVQPTVEKTPGQKAQQAPVDAP